MIRHDARVSMPDLVRGVEDIKVFWQTKGRSEVDKDPSKAHHVFAPYQTSFDPGQELVGAILAVAKTPVTLSVLAQAIAHAEKMIEKNEAYVFRIIECHESCEEVWHGRDVSV